MELSEFFNETSILRIHNLCVDYLMVADVELTLWVRNGFLIDI